MNTTKKMLMTGSAGVLIAAALAGALVPAASQAQKVERQRAAIVPAASQARHTIVAPTPETRSAATRSPSPPHCRSRRRSPPAISSPR